MQTLGATDAYGQAEGRVSAPDFRVLNPTFSEDRVAWEAAWSGTTHREVQAHPSYALAMTRTGATPLGAIAATPEGTAILPFTVRDIPIESGNVKRDAITPYGYGGAYSDGRIDNDWFWGCWDAWARAKGVAGITVRSHLFTDEVLHPLGSAASPMDNVVMDLTRAPEEIWLGYAGRLRRHIRRAEREGVSVEIDVSQTYLGEFHKIYTEAMTEKGADQFYFFEEDALRSFASSLGTGVALVHARFAGRIVSSEMLLVGRKNAYYFLGATNAEGRRARANPLLKHKSASWLQGLGLARYVLGGGMTRDDSLFRYKKAFSPDITWPFTVTFHESVYGAASDLLDARAREEPGWRPMDGFIPQYRSPNRSEVPGPSDPVGVGMHPPQAGP